MTKKVVFLLFIPIFILLYYSSGSGNTTLGVIGIILFLLVAISQIVFKNKL